MDRQKFNPYQSILWQPIILTIKKNTKFGLI